MLASAALPEGSAKIVAFGKAFIVNRDLVSRMRDDAPFDEWDGKTFYGGDECGCLDYPTLGPV